MLLPPAAGTTLVLVKPAPPSATMCTPKKTTTVPVLGKTTTAPQNANKTTTSPLTLMSTPKLMSMLLSRTSLFGTTLFMMSSTTMVLMKSLVTSRKATSDVVDVGTMPSRQTLRTEQDTTTPTSPPPPTATDPACACTCGTKFPLCLMVTMTTALSSTNMPTVSPTVWLVDPATSTA
eukprot:Lithocolla_globosa_v1_NODE_3972_length_1540_cov_782.240404.p3 type:complete len:177 gc:universal NODE_3972_length_1540_cov_782.240404:847-1377(+)